MSSRNVHGMPIVDVAMAGITDWGTFHDTFAQALGFPDFYGRNMNACIDCLTYEDDGMTAFLLRRETSSHCSSKTVSASAAGAPRSMRLSSTPSRS